MSCDLLLLIIEMGNINGIELARKLRDNDDIELTYFEAQEGERYNISLVYLPFCIFYYLPALFI